MRTWKARKRSPTRRPNFRPTVIESQDSTPSRSRSGPGGVTFSKPPRLIGHRGAMAVAPENTLASFQRAAIDGADWIEFDTRLSADGVPIIFHDDTLERTSDGKGPVSAILPRGCKVSTLGDGSRRIFRVRSSLH